MSSVVNRRDGATSLSNLRVGDEVLCETSEGALQYDRVIGFLHWVDDADFAYLRLEYGDGSYLTVHKDHYVSVQPHDTAATFDHIQANDVNVGDLIKTVWIDGTLSESRVRSITEVQASGLCCPVTMGGTIIVDSVSCSCYSPPSGILPMRVSHGLCHAALAPMRWAHKDTVAESPKTRPGVHPYARFLMTLVTGAYFS